MWFADDASAPTCIVDVLVEKDTQRLHHGSWGASAATAVGVILCAITAASESPTRLRFAALERSLVDPLAAALSEQRPPLRLDSHARCGLYMRSAGSPLPPPSPPPPGTKLRALRASDAPTLDSHWTYASATSLPMITAMVAAGGPGNVGVESADGELIGWIARYADGALGMLYVRDPFRRCGIASTLVAAAARALDEAGLPCFGYIVDGNVASEALFARLGWRRAADADWVSFVRAGEG